MKNDDIIKAALKRMGEAIDADLRNREEALDDLENIAGRQWDEAARTAREAENRPCLVTNRLPQFVRQVTGDIRQLNPAILVLPGDGKASKETADVIKGMIRHIEYRSGATNIYEAATESAAACGMGYFRILTEYEGPMSFNQEILIKRVKNPFSVYFDPTAAEPTRSDANWCFITEQMKSDDFKEAYPDASLIDVDHDKTDGLANWMEAGSVVVAEYFWKEPFTRKIGLLESGEVIENPQAIHNVKQTRTVEDHKVMWAKITGKDVLEGPQEVASSHIPVVAVIGEEVNVGDEVIRTSVIRYAKDPQKLYNYWTSANVEMIALQPKVPFLVTAKQIAGVEGQWEGMNDTTAPYVIYNPDDKAPGPPQRVQPPVPAAGMSQEILRAVDDMKATTGIYDAGLGQRSNEKSGVAIRQRQMESDISTSIYADNMGKAIEHCGRILLDMIPRVYDTQRIVRIVNDDDQEEFVPINAFALGPNMERLPVNVLQEGKYDVKVTVGPNYTTRRQETAESMMKFVSAFPPAGQVAGDLIAKAMDWPDSDKIAARLEKMLPPGMLEDAPPPQPDPVQMQALQMQQQGMQAKLRQDVAKADEAEAKAQGAKFGVMDAQLELAAKSGQLNAAISQLVQQEVARALMQIGAQQPGQFGPM